MKSTLVAGVAELIGTSILVLVGCMGCVASLGVVPPHLQITLTFGLAVMVVIQVSRQSEVFVRHMNDRSTLLSYLRVHLKLGKKKKEKSQLRESRLYVMPDVIPARAARSLLISSFENYTFDGTFSVISHLLNLQRNRAITFHFVQAIIDYL